jgi:hypothetical protein
MMRCASRHVEPLDRRGHLASPRTHQEFLAGEVRFQHAVSLSQTFIHLHKPPHLRGFDSLLLLGRPDCGIQHMLQGRCQQLAIESIAGNAVPLTRLSPTARHRRSTIHTSLLLLSAPLIRSAAPPEGQGAATSGCIHIHPHPVRTSLPTTQKALHHRCISCASRPCHTRQQVHATPCCHPSWIIP